MRTLAARLISLPFLQLKLVTIAVQVALLDKLAWPSLELGLVSSAVHGHLNLLIAFH